MKAHPIRNGGFGDVFTGHIGNGRKVENRGPQRRVGFAGSNGKVTGCATQIDQVLEPIEIELADDGLGR